MSAIVLVALLWYLGLVPGFQRENYHGPTLVNEAVSPDGRYLARAERMSNDSGWCEVRTNVDPVGQRSDWEHDYVFNINCGVPTIFKWTGDRGLTIYYGFDESGKVSVSRDAFSKDGQVTISYKLIPD